MSYWLVSPRNRPRNQPRSVRLRFRFFRLTPPPDRNDRYFGDKTENGPGPFSFSVHMFCSVCGFQVVSSKKVRRIIKSKTHTAFPKIYNTNHEAGASNTHWSSSIMTNSRRLATNNPHDTKHACPLLYTPGWQKSVMYSSRNL